MRPSTAWRSKSNASGTRGVSPTRPNEWIERLSPVPFEPSATTHTPFSSERSHGSGRRVQGLGLLQTNFLEDSYGQPDHLYFDKNGGAHIGSKPRSGRTGHRNDVRPVSESSRYGKSKTHTRSGSTIDDLANIAIATSPQLTSPSHSFSGSPITYSTRPATSHLNGYTLEIHDRPAKRIKSEKLRSAEWYPREERPKSSYEHHPQVRQEDAELLLSLRNGNGSISSLIPSQHTSTELPNLSQTQANKLSYHEPTYHSDRAAAGSFLPSIAESNVGNTGQKNHTDQGYISAPRLSLPFQEPPIEHASGQEEAEAAAPTDTSDGSKAGLEDEEPTKPPIQVATGTAEAETDEPLPAPPPKKQRKVKPEVQAEVCAACKQLQVDGNDAEYTMFWLGCEACKRWFHYPCAGFKDKQEARSVDKYICKDCESEHGQTTFVRKSSRARTAIDYAGLNEGVIKSSEDTTMHHYVPKLKDGTLSYQPDDFARVRPELLTKEFWENMDGMKRPFVVPACWNPRFGDATTQPNISTESMIAQPATDPMDVFLTSEGKELDVPAPSQATEDVSLQPSQETVIDVEQDYLDMVMPRHLTVQKVAELYGPDEPLPVIDVKTQETTGKWSLQQWANYYDEPDKKSIRNVISLEVSNSRLGRLIRRPRAVRDIDLEDQVWEAESRSASNKRPVQFYCLMSVADSYTDFHIDFGGSSVYYHILKGVKTFFFIPPEEKYLKKYEEWCTSATQSTTWLGDLCGGNVTRVDLHEGDTAFIPAGWIHSVWTPEDSLVIGGNFLTRYDFELQLKIAQIEKTTSVPLKYRYPFFQKVMWYTLIEYLEEDPVPEEILQNFQDDPEYRYIRANPIWVEQVDSAFAFEPEDLGYNSRNYSKSELNGMPALRDYLYRTSRIYADLPVEGGINKKQSDAVKASIPKGYGDPMQLIKTFAVWCAWKIGNVLVPEWVFNDSGLQPELEKREKEKAKKPEIFRVPPERVSARQKAQASATSANEDRETTPNSAKSAKMQYACESCRKRRIKCKHKEDTPLEETAQQTLEKPRIYSNVGVDIARLARASPMFNAVEASPLPEPVADVGDNKDLAQAALAKLNSQSSDTNGSVAVANGASPGSAKKGRSKACEECRKSKRRCVHDEYGRVDPAKAAEPSKPRGSSNTKRPARLSDENSVKRVKIETDVNFMANFPASMDVDSMIDPALLGSAIIDDNTPMLQDNTNPSPFLSDTRVLSTPPHTITAGEFHPPQPGNIDPALSRLDATMGDGQTEEATEVSSNQLQAAAPGPSPIASRTPDHDKSYSPITVDGAPTESIEKVEPADQAFQPQSAASRRSSRQPQQIERYVPDPNKTPSKSQPKSTPAQRRGSSVTSPRTEVMSAKSRRSSSNTSGTTHQVAGNAKSIGGHSMNIITQPVAEEEVKKPSSRDSTADLSEEDADEKLARELHAAEHGLRRRASVRA